MSLINMAGEKFGSLVVIQRYDNDQFGSAQWLCLCKCEKRPIVRGANLRSGKTKSCGCLQKEIVSTHGMYKSAEFSAWQSMLQRCYNKKNKGYKNYGGRGITVDDRWLKFENFYEDMGPRKDSKLSIERRDNNKGYSPSNCYWATAKEQTNNRRSNRFINVNGRQQTLTQWAREVGISGQAMSNRFERWEPEKAIIPHKNNLKIAGK